MFESIFNFLDKIITDFSWRRLLTFVAFFMLLGAIVFIAESYTNYFSLNKLEKETFLLKEIAMLKPKIENDSTLKIIYVSLTKELDHLVNNESSTPSINPMFLRFFAGAFPWILLTIAFVPGFKRGTTTSSTLVGGIIFIIIFGGAGLLLPSSWGSTIHYIIYPLGHFLIVAFIALIFQAKNKKAT
ncbi:MAG: hypothetical protein FD122_205 [Stygiobacter sp.]|nr:MAG: hypothetical protein FD122_205 [Stygiobacter sp.]KAF0217702.1 MAG: hypothetical protein FD178_514 [Ignavibacteria bacterium]